LLKGAISPEEVEKFTKLLNDLRWFIAEQIGITSLMPAKQTGYLNLKVQPLLKRLCSNGYSIA
jgi:hypothetical protein